MPAKTRVSVEEYLHTSFEGLDREYVDGEVIERAMPDEIHSATQVRMIEIFYELRKRFPLYARSELRHRVSPTRFRIPDIAVFAGQRPSERVPQSPPLIAIEILSPDDRIPDLTEKLKDYLRWGVRYIWIIDPYGRSLAVFGPDGLREVQSFSLAEYPVTITPEEVFGELPMSE
jgi:Uma2 family endonuclease